MIDFFIDLHVHTTASDGTFTPIKVIELAKEAGLKAISITDHDTVDGIKELQDNCSPYDIEIIPGIEFSINFEPEMHLLGYFVDTKSKELTNVLDRIKKQRFLEIIKVFSKLKSLGISIEPDEVQRLMGRVDGYNIANLLIKKGYAKDRKDVFQELLSEGKPVYVRKEGLSPQEAIQIIKNAGGICFLAHPDLLGRNEEQLEKILDELISYGIDGIECYHSLCSIEKQKLFIKMAKEHELLISGGSDFHGKSKPGIEIGRGYGNLYISYELLEKMKARRK